MRRDGLPISPISDYGVSGKGNRVVRPRGIPPCTPTTGDVRLRLNTHGRDGVPKRRVPLAASPTAAAVSAYRGCCPCSSLYGRRRTETAFRVYPSWTPNLSVDDSRLHRPLIANHSAPRPELDARPGGSSSCTHVSAPGTRRPIALPVVRGRPASVLVDRSIP
jgi:hypothetical protein